MAAAWSGARGQPASVYNMGDLIFFQKAFKLLHGQKQIADVKQSNRTQHILKGKHKKIYSKTQFSQFIYKKSVKT